MSEPRRLRVPSSGRLVYYGADPNLVFWEDHWGRLDEEAFRLAATGYLGHLPSAVLSWLPRNERILEAGCGPGTVALALRARGYKVEGVEWAADLVSRVLGIVPDAPIRVGDATNLDVRDGTYGACLSLGVCEHRAAGPEPFLLELHRVLRPGGVLIVSVPHYHLVRRLAFGLSQAGQYVSQRSPFYQYAFRPEEFQSLLKAHRFEVAMRTGYGVWFGLVDDFPWLRVAERIPVLGHRLPRLAEMLPLVPRSIGHMTLFVAHKR